MARLNLGKVLVTLEGEHDSSRSYDKYCEVTSGGSSYVSKKAVPIGTPITDTAFWQLRASKGADGTDGTNGNDGLDAYQPFKGWYSSTSELNTSFGAPQVGDYAYIKGATANDPVAIYQCTTAGTWTDSGRTFNPSNNQEFASGESLNTVRIVNNLNGGSTNVLSAEQGKVLDQKVSALGPKVGEIDGELKNKFGGNISVASLPNSGYINTNGSIYPSANHSYSDPIKMYAGDTVTVSSTGNGFSVLSETNSTGTTYTLIKGASGSTDTSVTYTYTATEDIYICITARTAAAYSVLIERVGIVKQIIENNQTNITNCTEEIEAIKDALPTTSVIDKDNAPASDMEQGLVDGSGSKSSNSKRIRTKKPIDLTDVTEIGLLDNTTYSFWIRFFDSSDNVVLSWDLAGMNPNSNAAATTSACNVNAVRVSYPQISYAYVVVRKIVDADLTPTETFYVKKNKAVYEEILGIPIVLHDYATNLEYGGIQNDGTMTDCDDGATFFSTLRTKNFLKLRNFSLTLSNCTAKVFLYAHDFSLVAATDYSVSFDISDYKTTCSYYKVVFSISSDWEIVFQTAEYEEMKNAYTESAVSFLYEIAPCSGRDLSADDVSGETTSDYTSQLPSEKYYNSGLLRLPPNYQPNGEPSKLILWAHGSGWYGSLITHDFNTNYLNYIKYLQKEGYAVFDCYGASSKYGNTGNNALANPTNMSCIFAAYRWVIEHYNIDATGIYVTGKSLGGIVDAAMLFQNSIPVKACCPLAPELDPRSIQLGYTETVRIDYCDDMGFTGASVVEGTDATHPMTDEVFQTLLSSNESQMCGFVPPLCGVVSPTIAELAPYPAKNIIYNSVRRICKVPLKIFIAADDAAVNYNACKYFVKSIKATGGIAELRTMPSNTGGHHAVDYGDDANNKPSIKVDVTTALGYECNDVPLAWAEMVQFFRLFA